MNPSDGLWLFFVFFFFLFLALVTNLDIFFSFSYHVVAYLVHLLFNVRGKTPQICLTIMFIDK